MLSVPKNHSATRHSYQSTGNQDTLVSLSKALPAGMLKSRQRQGKQLRRSSDFSVTNEEPVAKVISQRDPDGKKSSRSGQDGLSSNVNQMALLYAMFVTLFGFVFPLSKYVSKNPFSKWYLCGFYLLIYSISISFLILFMCWIMNRPPYKLFVENAVPQSGELVRLQESERPIGRVEFQVGRFSVSESFPNLKESNCDLADGCQNGAFDDVEEPGHSQVVLHEPGQVADLAESDSINSGRHEVKFDTEATGRDSTMDTVTRQNAYLKRINSTLIQNAKELGVHEIQAYSVLSLHESHSPSFFLRVACFLFGGLKMTHDFLHVVDDMTDVANGCSTYVTPGSIAQSFLSIIFTVLQTFFIFKYSKVSVNIYQKVSVFGFMHLMATNMCVWFEAILLETSHASYSSDTYESSSNDSRNYSTTAATTTTITTTTTAANSVCSKEVFWRMAPYLFPFTIEYSLMAAFSCYVLFCNVGKFLEVIVTKGFNMGKKCLRNRKKSQTSFNASCYKSDKGFFLGALQMIVGVVSGIYFTIYVNEESDTKVVSKYIYLITDLLLLSANLVLCILANYNIRKLTLVHKMSTGPDSWLLGITLMGVLAFELFQLFGASAESHEFLGLRITKGILVVAQSTFQVFVVFDGEKRRARTVETIEQKPGREMIAALLLGNLALWVVYTLEVREINLPKYNDAYVPIASQIFSYVCSPLIIFFRFHSACCFVEVWRHSYKGKSDSRKDCQHSKSESCDKEDKADPDATSIKFQNSCGELQNQTATNL